MRCSSRHGIARVNSVTAFVETLKFLHHGGPLAGQPHRVDELLGRRGGARSPTWRSDTKVRFPPFDAAARRKIAATLNEYVADRQSARLSHLHLEPGGQAHGDLLRRARGRLRCRRCSSSTFRPSRECGPTPGSSPPRAMMNAAKATKARAAVVASLPECMPMTLADELRRRRHRADDGPRRRAHRLRSRGLHRRATGRGARAPPAMPQRPRRGGGQRPLSEFAAKQLLRAHGLAVPAGIVCTAGRCGRGRREARLSR